MNDFKISRDDPRLTAYALGELEGDERAAVEAALRHDPAARAWIEEIRATAGQVEAALAAEAVEDSRASREQERPAVAQRRRAQGWRNLVRFPQVYYVVGGLAAACFAIFVAVQPETQRSVPAPGDAEKIVEDPIATTLPLPAGKTETVAENELSDPEPINSTLVTLDVDTAKREIVAPRDAGLVDVSTTPEGRLEVPANDIRITQGPAIAVPPPVAFSGDQPAPPNDAAPGPAPQDAPSSATPRGLAENKPLRSESPAPGQEGVVRLSPFEVTVDRDSGAAGVATAGSRAAQRRQRAGLPSAPRGARFAAGEGEDASARDNEFVAAVENPLSTFSPEVETASYASTRRSIESGRLPPRDAVRIEELVNYFPYRYAPPKGDAPFAAELVVTEAPWAPAHRLVRIALKGREATDVASTPHPRTPVNLVFLIDVSTSMKTRNKLPLVQEAIRRLVTRLQPDDRVAIVTYSGGAGVVLPSMPASRAREISEAVGALIPERGTHELTGLPLAYHVARTSLVPNGINRVILCTDGDFNLGVDNPGELLRLVANRAQFGVSLSVIALGMGEARHTLVPALAQHGKGRFGYIETRPHAERLLAAEIEGTLTTLAQDVKIQVEFNPAKVARYRLIGYENRLLRPEDFNDDHVDGAVLGAGHTLTALYEIVPHDAEPRQKEAWAALEDLRYGHLRPVKAADGSAGQFDSLSNELLTVKVRYKNPDGLLSRKLEFPLVDGGAKFAEANGDFKFAAAVAGFGMILRGSPHRGAATMRDVIAWATMASANSADDPGGYRREFVGLARQTETLLR